MLFAGLGSTSKSAISLFFSSYLTLALSSPPCPLLRIFFYLKLSGRSGRNCLLFSPSSENGSPDTRFSRGTTRLMSWPDGERTLFSNWRRTVSSKFFDTQVPSISTEGLVLSRHTRCVLFCLRCDGHSLLLSYYLSRISRIENPSCSDCGHPS